MHEAEERGASGLAVAVADDRDHYVAGAAEHAGAVVFFGPRRGKGNVLEAHATSMAEVSRALKVHPSYQVP